MAAPVVIPMPARGDRVSPKFDPKQPRELRRFFDDLEFLFNRAGVTDEAEKKTHTCRYVDVDTSELWASLPDYTNVGRTYEQLRDAIYELYPGSEEERKWSVADMDKLTGERLRLGIQNLADLGDFHRQFLAITTFLRSKNRISENEQCRAFARGIAPDLWARIEQRLQIKLPDHFPGDPYPMPAMHEAARYFLHGTASTILTTATLATSPTIQPATTVKTEDFSAMLERITETFVKALAASHQPTGANPFNYDPNRQAARAAASEHCNFCGGPQHYMRDCEVVEQYIRDGKIKKNEEGRIVLASGYFLPRRITGQHMKDRVDEYYRQYPGEVPTGTLMYGVLSNGIAETSETKKYTMATRRSHPDELASIPKRSEVISYPLQLTTQERIESMERELFQLRGRRPEMPVRTRAERAAANERRKRDISPEPEQAAPQDDVEEAPVRREARVVPEVVIPVQATGRTAGDAFEAAPQIEPPIHPFAEVRDATYAAPNHRNFASLPKPNPAKKPEPAYRTLPPIYDGKIAEEVYDRAMSAPVTLTQRELLSLAPEVRSAYRESISAKRSGPKEVVKEIHTLVCDEQLAVALDNLDADDEATTTATFINNICSPSPSESPTPHTCSQDHHAFQPCGEAKPKASFMVDLHQPSDPPPGAFVIPDPYETYLKTVPEGQTPDILVVARESSALRSIFPRVDHQQIVEAILDPGSQIIAMSEGVCMDLALIYDPTIVLNMQSANGEVDKSLGLARNVPLLIGDITLYVQVHIIRSPAYDILLGRPFDILTESVVRNYANEDQTVTIMDPNSRRCATVPTWPRGRPRRGIERQSFQTSMN